jgi:hypothetical protein
MNIPRIQAIDTLQAVGYAKKDKNVERCEGNSKALKIDCALSECKNAFHERKGKKYCSTKCRVRASDLRKVDQVRKMLIDGTLDEKDIQKIARILNGKLATNKKKKPFRMHKSHRDLLEWIDAEPTGGLFRLFIPSNGGVPISWERRARELRAEGILESFKVCGGRVAFHRPEKDIEALKVLGIKEE